MLEILPFNRRWLERGDLFLTLLFLTTMAGAIYGSSDDMFIIPGVYQIESPQLYSNDLAFTNEQGTTNYHAFGQYILFFLSRWLPIEYCIFFLITLWRFCLVVGMLRLTRQIEAGKIPILTIATLIFFNPRLAGYSLTANFYAVHFAALSLSILSFSYWISGEKITSLGLLILAGLFHPLIGAGSLIFFIGACIYQIKLRYKILVSATLLAGLGIIEFGGIDLLTRLDPEVPWTEVARIKVFVRGSWHLSPEYWGRWEIINYLIVMLFLISSWKTWKEEKIRMISFCGILGGSIVAAGILNNLLLIEPFLVLLNPFEIGPFVLAIAYVLAARFLFEMLQKKYYLSSLAIILSLSLQTWLIFILIWVLRVFLPEPLISAHSSRNDLILLSFIGLAVAVQFQFWGKGWVGDVSSTIIQQRAYVFLFATVGFLILYWLRKLTLESWVCAVCIGFLASAAVMGQLKWFEMQRPWTRDWQEVCEFSLKHSSVGSTFIIPPEIESFQYLSRRSSFLSFKHFPLDLKQVGEWYARMQRLGLISPFLDPNSIRNPVEIKYDLYDRLETEAFLKINRQYTFIDYCIVRKRIHLSLPEVFFNASYRIYRFPDFNG